MIDLERRRVQRGDRRISLTPTEFEILRHLASGRVGSTPARELLDLLRDYEALDQDEKTINVHVSHLRDKLEDDPTAPGLRPDDPRCRLRVRRALRRAAARSRGASRLARTFQGRLTLAFVARRRGDARPRGARRPEPARRLLRPAAGGRPRRAGSGRRAVRDPARREHRASGPAGRGHARRVVDPAVVAELARDAASSGSSRTGWRRPTSGSGSADRGGRQFLPASNGAFAAAEQAQPQPGQQREQLTSAPRDPSRRPRPPSRTASRSRLSNPYTFRATAIANVTGLLAVIGLDRARRSRSSWPRPCSRGGSRRRCGA